MFLIFFFNIGASKSFSPNFQKLYGNWIIQDSTTKVQITDNLITVDSEGSQVAMTPNIITNQPLKIHLNSLTIKKYPTKLTPDSFKALKWIHKINVHGIDLEFQNNQVYWNIHDIKNGSCHLIPTD